MAKEKIEECRLMRGKFFKPDGTRLKVGENFELTEAQRENFKDMFVPISKLKADAEAAQANVDDSAKDSDPKDKESAAATKPAATPTTKPSTA